MLFTARSPEQTVKIRKEVSDYVQASDEKRREERLTRNQAEELTRKLGVLLDIGTSVPGKDAFVSGTLRINNDAIATF